MITSNSLMCGASKSKMRSYSASLARIAAHMSSSDGVFLLDDVDATATAFVAFAEAFAGDRFCCGCFCFVVDGGGDGGMTRGAGGGGGGGGVPFRADDGLYHRACGETDDGWLLLICLLLASAGSGSGDTRFTTTSSSSSK